MLAMSKWQWFVLGLLMLLVTGCATIMSEPDQQVQLQSSPSEAKVTVTDENGQKVFSGTTPTSVVLQKAGGGYFDGKSYQVAFSKPGYKARNLAINSTPNGWYIGGNFVFGGLIGWLIVDPLSGSMYKLAPQEVSATLEEDADQRQLGLMMLEDVPAHLRSQMEPLR